MELLNSFKEIDIEDSIHCIIKQIGVSVIVSLTRISRKKVDQSIFKFFILIKTNSLQNL